MFNGGEVFNIPLFWTTRVLGLMQRGLCPIEHCNLFKLFPFDRGHYGFEQLLAETLFLDCDTLAIAPLKSLFDVLHGCHAEEQLQLSHDGPTDGCRRSEDLAWPWRSRFGCAANQPVT